MQVWAVLIALVFGGTLPVVITDGVSRHVDNVNGNDSTPCLQGVHPCATLHYALTQLENNTAVILDVPSVVHLSDSYVFGIRNLSILSSLNSSDIDCKASGGFAFHEITELKITNVRFTNCSAIRNSTSYSRNGDRNDYLVAIYMYLCRHVIMDSIHVVDSPGVGVAMLSVTGNVTISNSKFLSNGYLTRDLESLPDVNTAHTSPGGGGLMIELVSCPPGTLLSNCNGTEGNDVNETLLPSYQDVAYNIDNCDFLNNSAETPDFEDYSFLDYPNTSFYNAIGRGGGISFFIKGRSTNVKISISNSRFEYNYALYGAGIFVELWHYPINVSVTIAYTYVANNSLPYNSVINFGPGGAGLRFAQFNSFEGHADGNTLTIQHSQFEDNRAYFGAGASMLFQMQPSIDQPFLIENTTFKRNTARIGSAMDLHSRTAQRATLVMRNIFVLENSLEYAAKGQVAFIHGEGIVYVNTLNVLVEGSNIFTDNRGSAITALYSDVSFMSGTRTLFKNNTAFRGGGLSLLGSSTMYVFKNSSLVFEKNTVATKGGAIFHTVLGNRALLDTHACPIQRGHPSLNWDEVSLKFINNVAYNRGHSIYVYSFSPCVEHRLINLNQTFQWEGFSYNCTITECQDLQNFYILLEQSLTDLNQTFQTFSYNCTCGFRDLQVSGDGTMVNESKTQIVAFPGEQIELPLFFYDDMYQQVTVELDSLVVDKMENERRYPLDIVNNSQIKVTGQPNTHADLILHSSGGVILGITLQLDIVRCPPGWRRNSHDSFDAQCICIEPSLPGLICNSVNFSATLERNTWVGYPSGGGVETGTCPKGFCLPLPKLLEGSVHYNQSSLSKEICGGRNRTGVLCGECEEGFGISFTYSHDFHCIPCHDSSINVASFFIWFGLEFLPLNILLILLIIFKINLLTGWNGLLYTFILFFQVVTTTPAFVYQYETDLNSTADWYPNLLYINQFLSDLWNLKFFSIFVPESVSCLHQGFTTQELIVVIYFTIVLWPVIVYLCLLGLHHLYRRGKCCHCLYKCVPHIGRYLSRARPTMPNTTNSSYINSLCSFFILAYMRVVVLFSEIISKGTIHAASFGERTERAVFFYNGSIEWFGPQHAPYAVPVILFTIVTVLIPTILLFSYPLIPRSIEVLKISTIRPFSWINRGLSNAYLKHIFDTFQGCFDNNARYFAAFYLVYRLLFILVRSLTSDYMNLVLGQLVLVAVFASLHSFFHPFRDKTVNRINGLVLTNLAFVILLSMYSIFVDRTAVSSQQDYNTQVAAKVFTIVALFLPHLIVIGYLGKHLCINFKAFIKKRNKKLNENDTETSDLQPTSLSVDTTEFIADDHDIEWEDARCIVERDTWAGENYTSSLTTTRKSAHHGCKIISSTSKPPQSNQQYGKHHPMTNYSTQPAAECLLLKEGKGEVHKTF